MLPLDPNRIAIGGGSAGGNLTVTTALKFIQDKDIQAKLVLLIALCPNIDVAKPYEEKFKAASPEARAVSVPIPMIRVFNDSYSKPLISPCYASDAELGQFPKTLILTADLDALHVEGDLFAEQLKKAGVDVVHHLYTNSAHGFTMLQPGAPAYNAETKEAGAVLTVNELRKAFA